MGAHAAMAGDDADAGPHSRCRRLRAQAQRLRQQPADRGGRDDSGHEDEHEAGTPAESRLQQAADQRRDDRGEPHDHRHEGELAAGARALIEIAHHRARQHDGAGRPEGLHETRADQRRDRRRHGADQGGDAEDQKRGEHHWLAAVAVGERPIDDLARPEADQIGRDRELDLTRRRRERAADLRQRRQIEIDRERSDGGEQREQRREGERVGAEHEPS